MARLWFAVVLVVGGLPSATSTPSVSPEVGAPHALHVASVRSGAGAPHDLHITSGNAAVEGNLIVTRIRFFKDDLESALRLNGAGPDFVLADDPATDAAFMAYFRDRYVVWVGGVRISPTMLAKGEDELDREPIWWYAVQHEAPEVVEVFRVRNTLLFELFDDQRNIVKFVHFPDETQRTFSFGEGDEEFEVRF